MNSEMDGVNASRGEWQLSSLRFQVLWAELWKLFCAKHVGNQETLPPFSGPRAEAHSVSSSKLCDPGEGILISSSVNEDTNSDVKIK